MKKFLIDANLPYYFSPWRSEDYIQIKDLNDEWTDDEVWNYAKNNNLTIVSKDSDFSNRILLQQPPPKVIHIKFGNIKLNEFHKIISNVWLEVCNITETHKLVNVFRDRIEGIS